MSTRETEAAEALRSKPVDAGPRPADPEPEAEAPEEGKPTQMQRPFRRYKWIDDSRMTVAAWLSGVATADIEVFPGVVFRFHEAKNSELREADAFVNAMGPKFMMRGLMSEGGVRDDMPRGEQWARARNVAMVAMTITHMGGDPWPQGDSFAQKFREVDDLGHIKVDRLIEAMGEFTEQLAWVIRQADLGNS